MFTFSRAEGEKRAVRRVAFLLSHKSARTEGLAYVLRLYVVRRGGNCCLIIGAMDCRKCRL